MKNFDFLSRGSLERGVLTVKLILLLRRDYRAAQSDTLQPFLCWLVNHVEGHIAYNNQSTTQKIEKSKP